jgi:hypothetical protein
VEAIIATQRDRTISTMEKRFIQCHLRRPGCLRETLGFAPPPRDGFAFVGWKLV